MTFVWLALLGLGLGTIGTLVGAGGGFLLVPILVLLYPNDEPETITAISLTMVFFNAASGSLGYWRQKRIDLRSAGWFALASVPGAVLGALTSTHIPIVAFRLLLGVVLIAVAVVLFFKKPPAEKGAAHAARGGFPHITHNRWLGMGAAFGVGYISSLLGIGGGIIHVPLMVHLLGFPVHIATATSHLVLAVTSAAGVTTHIVTGAFHTGVRRALAISAGVVIGAQVGAALAPRVPARLILRVLSVAMAVVGARVILLVATGG